MTAADKDYWNARGKVSYQYKGETFYTVTPIPFYYKRREILLEMMEPFIKEAKHTRLCDFGCGDGWYIQHFLQKYPDKTYYGIDLSEAMINRAKVLCPAAQLAVSDQGIQQWHDLNVVYSTAVFAHVMNDQLVAQLFNNIFSQLADEGYFLMFEQTGPVRRQGDAFCRRTAAEYITLAENAGFTLVSAKLVTFNIHRWFEYKCAGLYRKLFIKGDDYNSQCINANKSAVFKLLSAMMVRLSYNVIREYTANTYGNTFYVFRKNASDKGSVN
jgi:SAM-dependent methyltransferase